MLTTYHDLMRIFLTDFMVDVDLYTNKLFMVDVDLYLIKHLMVGVDHYLIKFPRQFFNKFPMG